MISKVKDLMNHRGEGWNEGLVRKLFSSEEAQVILKIPVSSMGTSNRLVWHGTSNGYFSVASGYRFAKELKKKAERGEGTSRTGTEDDTKMWNNIWQLQVKKKIQHFLWKAVHDRLPVGTNLKKRDIIEDVDVGNVD